MPDELCTVDEAAERLKLHPKTVLRHIREGRLPARRLGKAYRIRRSDLDAFAGLPPREPAPAENAWTTVIVDVPGVGAALAQTWARTITGALGARRRSEGAMRAEVIYSPEREHLKVVIVGPPGDAARLLGMIDAWLEQLEP
jgi:excisionase family DNA binding protein